MSFPPKTRPTWEKLLSQEKVYTNFSHSAGAIQTWINQVNRPG